MKFLTATLLFLMATLLSHAQNIGINTDGTSPHASAILDVKSTTKGILIPRMTMAQRNAISTPAAGLMIYQTDNTPGFYFFDGATWSGMSGSTNNAWSMTGNSGTNPANHFLGTTDIQPLRFRVNNKWVGELNWTAGNIFFGDSSGIANTTGAGNVGFGYQALKMNTTGYLNVAIGALALEQNTSPGNTAVGALSLQYNTTGLQNTGIGNYAMNKNTLGQDNTALGFQSLFSNLTGARNTAVGSGALQQSLTSNNTALGYSALKYTTQGDENVAAGAYSMEYNIGGSYNAALGMFALRNNTLGHYNTALGAYALHANTSAVSNTGIGYRALYSNTASNNTAVGYYAMYFNSTAAHNTAIGFYSMYSNTNAINNTAVGAFALYANSLGISNTAVGNEALYFSSGQYNTSLGVRSAYNTTSGGGNVALGFWSLYNNTTGGQNTAIGTEALAYNSTGVYNISVGAYSGTSSSYDNTISIGNNGISNSWHNQALFGNTSTVWNGGNVGWSTWSDARVKKNISDEVKGLDFITRLRPVTYHRDIDLQTQITGNRPTEDLPHKYDIEQIKFSGFLAQEVEQAAKACGYDFSGITTPKSERDLYTLSYESFVVPLVKAVQELNVKVDMLENENHILIQQVERCEVPMMLGKQQLLIEALMAEVKALKAEMVELKSGQSTVNSKQ